MITSREVYEDIPTYYNTTNQCVTWGENRVLTLAKCGPEDELKFLSYTKGSTEGVTVVH